MSRGQSPSHSYSCVMPSLCNGCGLDQRQAQTDRLRSIGDVHLNVWSGTEFTATGCVSTDSSTSVWDHRGCSISSRAPPLTSSRSFEQQDRPGGGKAGQVETGLGAKRGLTGRAGQGREMKPPARVGRRRRELERRESDGGSEGGDWLVGNVCRVAAAKLPPSNFTQLARMQHDTSAKALHGSCRCH